MSLSTTETYYLRRWLQGFSRKNLAYRDSITQLLETNLLEERVSALNLNQQQQLAKLMMIRKQLMNNQNTQTSIKNLEVRILGLLQVKSKSTVEAFMPEHANVETWLGILNHISGLAQKYLGKIIVRNYWCGSKPISGWLAEFEVVDSGQIHYRYQSDTNLPLNQLLHPEQENHLRQWLKEFVRQCSQVLPRFSHMIVEAAGPGHEER